MPQQQRCRTLNFNAALLLSLADKLQLDEKSLLRRSVLLTLSKKINSVALTAYGLKRYTATCL